MAEVDEDKAMETSGVERERPLTNVETLKNASGKSCLAKTLNRRDCPGVGVCQTGRVCEKMLDFSVFLFNTKR